MEGVTKFRQSIVLIVNRIFTNTLNIHISNDNKFILKKNCSFVSNEILFKVSSNGKITF